MKRKTKNYLLIPDKFAQNFDDLEFIIDELKRFNTFSCLFLLFERKNIFIN